MIWHVPALGVIVGALAVASFFEQVSPDSRSKLADGAQWGSLVLLLAALVILGACLLRRAWWHVLGATVAACVAGGTLLSIKGLLIVDALFDYQDSFTEGLVVPGDYPMREPINGRPPGDGISATPNDAGTMSPLELIRGFQGGIYHVRARIRPGEKGRVHLRAYEPVRERPLSPSRIRRATLRTIGIEAESGAQLTYAARFTIYEGDWGDYYPARIEVWFEPADGGSERMLISDTFRVEGWMR